jgi:adenine-specific DNA-methyltransferase
MDFFSGSCTTAHAVLKLNHAYGGNRRFIMVQLPEPTELEDFPTIADIGKERIRRVIKKLQDETNGQLDLKDRDTPEDLGFKVFKLSSSNYQLWENVDGETDPDVYKDLLQGQDDPLVNGWKEEDVLYEIALKEGYSLNAVIEKEKVGSLTVYRIDDPEREQTFQVCLEKKLTLDALKPLNLKKDDLFICRNIALDDTIAANLALQCRLMVI